MTKNVSYFCRTGKHYWSHIEDAKKCCDSHYPIWEPMFEGASLRVLKSALEITEMDDKSSNPNQTEHLYRAQ